MSKALYDKATGQPLGVIGEDDYDLLALQLEEESLHDVDYYIDAATIDLLEPGDHGHFRFDLPAYVARRLRAAGVAAIADLGEDTYAQPDRFFSFRRATHRGEATGGRQTSVIGLGG